MPVEQPVMSTAFEIPVVAIGADWGTTRCRVNGCSLNTRDAADSVRATGMDYKSTLNLPRTEFPMRANLPQREPAILARWDEMQLYHRCLLYTSDAADER